MPNPKSWFGRGNTRALLISGAILALFVSTSAFAVGEGEPIEGGERNPTANQTQAYQKETEIIGKIEASGAQKGGYVTRQSNTSKGANAGGAVIYGCRATGNNPDTDESCIRANNLADGLAFTFESNGTLGGIISVGDGGREEKPFVTDATGVATGLNADEVDGIDGKDIQNGIAASRDRWALVGEDGRIIRQSGGFQVINCFNANANCYIDANENVVQKGLGATIAVQNNVEGVDPSLNGQIAVGACGETTINCAPAGTENNEAIVVAPRNADGTAPADATKRKRFYVHVTAAGAATATPAG
ncbi:MAG TPA: hypothetical protein VGW11_01545 [Solirubrobacteraceae bacterium]|nr:hypothetical protein [Solirubrobacteraceae bacterium]